MQLTFEPEGVEMQERLTSIWPSYDAVGLYNGGGIKIDLNRVKQVVIQRDCRIQLRLDGPGSELIPAGLISANSKSKNFLPSLEEHFLSASRRDELEGATWHLLTLIGLMIEFPPEITDGVLTYKLSFTPLSRLTVGSMLVINKSIGSIGVRKHSAGQMEEERTINSPLPVTDSKERKVLVWLQRIIEVLAIGGIQLDKRSDESAEFLRFRVVNAGNPGTTPQL